MKVFFRLFQFCKPIGPYLFPYIFYTVLSVIFGLLNFSLLIPMLNVLFGSNGDATSFPVEFPDFDWSLKFFEDGFYYYLGQALAIKGKYYALQFVTLSLVISVLLSSLFRYLSAREMESFKMQTIRNIREALFDKIFQLDIEYFSKERKGNIISKLTEDVGRVETTLTSTLSVFFKEPLTLIVYFITLITISFKITLFTVLVLPVSALVIGYFSKRLRSDSKEYAESNGRLISLIEESIGGIRVIKSFANEKFFNGKLVAENRHMTKTFLNAILKRELASPISEFFGVVSISFILLYGGSLVLTGNELSASQFIAYIVIFSQIMRPAKAISSSFTGIQVGMVSGERILEVLDEKIKINSNDNGMELVGIQNNITFSNVSFSHGDKPILKNVSQVFESKKMYALVGTSGGGKSTLIDLITRFYEPKTGNISWDGIPLSACNVKSLRQQMGIVTQESILFNDTIFNNIVFGRTNVTKEEVIKAAMVANAHDFISQMEDGYDTRIGDRGVRLSGGQKQRICIARAVLMNPPLLILDEATSALDTESEKLVQDALNHLLEDRTSIVIAHRLSTIQHADEILVIENGEIVERGTHTHLLQQPNSAYSKLIKLQSFNNKE